MSDFKHSLIIILVMGLVTLATRILPVLIFGRNEKIPKYIMYLGKVVPYTAMGLLIVYCFKDVSVVQALHALPELIAMIVVIASYLWKRKCNFQRGHWNCALHAAGADGVLNYFIYSILRGKPCLKYCLIWNCVVLYWKAFSSGEEMITVNLRYTGKGNAAIDFAKEMTESGVVEKIRAEKGNLRYEYLLPLFDDSADKTVLLIDQWENQEAIDIHHASPMMADIMNLREKYDLHMTVERFLSDEDGVPDSDKAFIRK